MRYKTIAPTISICALLVHSSALQAQTVTPKVRIVAPPHKHTGKGVLRRNSCPTLTYPELSLKLQLSGTGQAEVDIDPLGEVLGTRIVMPIGTDELDKAARSALFSCTYSPSFKDGVGIADTITVEYIWRLEPTPSVSFDSK